MSPIFWSVFGSILLANVVLSGDNAVVIAMAARTLAPEQRGKAIFWSSAAAIVMRIVLTVVANGDDGRHRWRHPGRGAGYLQGQMRQQGTRLSWFG